MPSTKKGSKKSSKKQGSSVFSSFTQQQVTEFKEGFSIMDADRDGLLNKSDVRNAFDIIGKIVSEKDLDDMLNDAPGPISFTMFVNMFAERQSGPTDDDETILKAFKAFDNGDGKVDSEQFRGQLMSFGDKMTGKEVDEVFAEMEFDDDNNIELEPLIEMIVGKTEEEAAATQEAAPAE
ncbi:Myosin regulatory light chain 2 [Amphibalanus amphitrite]|uniref:Myosin regulatory light chain 2 n=1 Tax=Amphibalanus amphitrite TaxID=1232801 RepID=A0A6A4W4Z9_AMPAM|nr:myosin regulatory light chain 2-like [Amphibalanus amphitrite]XP_043192849.1 myosin regulatory light chain 2-like [Amphibalanus amphitrite]XP_043196902.1 myosin regulatory light chain 2-like [Amphibalanus amphitrite]XP_043196903.1 myosin regulatory light chain 2-like [Amphibalanus amphitrite]KAF0301003.1 Myosin regulatory light chain 2 [Amphibalanus amphitrite]KAF0309870.1 Myosin regulatory light chain 2 [Amphibalanus amphitrite]